MASSQNKNVKSIYLKFPFATPVHWLQKQRNIKITIKSDHNSIDSILKAAYLLGAVVFILKATLDELGLYSFKFASDALFFENIRLIFFK